MARGAKSNIQPKVISDNSSNWRKFVDNRVSYRLNPCCIEIPKADGEYFGLLGVVVVDEFERHLKVQEIDVKLGIFGFDDADFEDIGVDDAVGALFDDPKYFVGIVVEDVAVVITEKLLNI